MIYIGFIVGTLSTIFILSLLVANRQAHCDVAEEEEKKWYDFTMWKCDCGSPADPRSDDWRISNFGWEHRHKNTNKFVRARRKRPGALLEKRR